MTIFGRSKYRAVRTEYNGRTYASKAEAARAEFLDLLVKADAIKAWTPQVPYMLGDTKYVCDFRVEFSDCAYFVEDVKGFETPQFKRVRKLWKKYGPCPLHIVKYRRGKWTTEVLNGGR